MQPTLLLASAGGKLFELGPFLVQLGIFLVLLGVLYKFFWKRVFVHLDKRQSTIRETFDKIERDKADVEKLTAEYKTKLAQIEREASAKVQAAVREGLDEKSRILQEAHDQLLKERQKAVADIQIEKEKAILELRKEIARLTLRVTEKVMGEAVTPEVQSRIVTRTLAELEAAAAKKP